MYSYTLVSEPRATENWQRLFRQTTPIRQRIAVAMGEVGIHCTSSNWAVASGCRV